MAGETSKTLEREVKASYIYNILKHASWHGRQSPRATKIAHVCIIGDRELSVLFRALEEHHKQYHEHDLAVNVTYLANGANIPDCHILFIGKAAVARVSRIIEQTRNRPILTVSDIKGFADKGGMIEFVKVKLDDRTNIRTRINTAGAEENGIALSSELLLLSDHVEKEELMVITDHLH